MLMQTGRLLGVLAVVLALLTGAASAQEGDGNIYGLIDVPTAEVRVGPDFAYDGIARLPLNTSVKINGRAGDLRPVGTHQPRLQQHPTHRADAPAQ